MRSTSSRSRWAVIAMRQPDPENAAAPGVETEGDDQIGGQRIEGQSTPVVASATIDYGAAINCPLACSAAGRWCPWQCPVATGVSS